jgi:hypothetical protein
MTDLRPCDLCDGPFARHDDGLRVCIDCGQQPVHGQIRTLQRRQRTLAAAHAPHDALPSFSRPMRNFAHRASLPDRSPPQVTHDF